MGKCNPPIANTSEALVPVGHLYIVSSHKNNILYYKMYNAYILERREKKEAILHVYADSS